jgi:hypothetical protein
MCIPVGQASQTGQVHQVCDVYPGWSSLSNRSGAHVAAKCLELLLRIRETTDQILAARRPAILTEVSRGFAQSLQANAGIVAKGGDGKQEGSKNLFITNS